MDLAILCSVIPARRKLLERSLYTWGQSIEASGLNAKVYLYLEDKDSNEWEDCYPYLHIDGKFMGDIKLADRSGSHIAGYNFWLEDYKVDADVFIFTHPDVLFPLTTVKTAYDSVIPNRFVAFKVFWIPEGMTQNLDKYNWKHPETLEEEPDLFPAVNFSDGHGDFYWNSDVRAKTEWHSTTTWAMDKNTLEKLRPFPNFGNQGADDPYFSGARQRLEMEDYVVMNPILFHQYHEKSWDGDAQKAILSASEELKKRFGS